MLNTLLRLLLTLTKLKADVNAVKRGRVPQRLFNRAAGKLSRNLMRRVWR